ncbi:uncharacterized protein LOC142349151 [Convolutriloba macropyga]|uniref:uncharacterized protein LOC142349151 n=1 Tax=Convolutriloba macropyga TaxID=536237 RepID=UPI003F523FE5
MVSRILARIVTSRIRDWSEIYGALDDNQDGFRQNRSTADAAQIAVRLHEDNRRLKEGDRDRACLLDLRKAYPRVSHPLLWKILESYGFEGRMLARIKDLHESTAYKVRSNREVSSQWIPQRGLREGCPSSPILFNLFHQVVMRAAELEREDDGLTITYLPGSACITQRRDQKNQEAQSFQIKNVLFADDTTILCQPTYMENAENTTKRIMGLFEEKTNEAKGEDIILGEPSAAETRFLGTWIGEIEDTNTRVKRGMGAWSKVKRRLKHSRLTKKTQARVIEAVVESAMLYNCNVRTWSIGEINRLQKKVDKCYRYVWSGKTQPPLKEMEKKKKNMWNVRKELMIKSVRAKIERRSLERLGHVIRLPEERKTRRIAFGWLSKLEETPKPKKKYRCTPRYWMKLTREAGWDPLHVEDQARDRKLWKLMIKERVTHIEQWEESKENGYVGSPLKRSEEVTREEEATECPHCKKICKSRAGLANHIKKMHRGSRVVHKCVRCAAEFNQKASLKNHQKKCQGTTSPTKYVPKTKTCPICQEQKSATNIARHIASCTRRHRGTPTG